MINISKKIVVYRKIRDVTYPSNMVVSTHVYSKDKLHELSYRKKNRRIFVSKIHNIIEKLSDMTVLSRLFLVDLNKDADVCIQYMYNDSKFHINIHQYGKMTRYMFSIPQVIAELNRFDMFVESKGNKAQTCFNNLDDLFFDYYSNMFKSKYIIQ